MSSTEVDFLKRLIGEWRYTFSLSEGAYTASGVEKIWPVGDWIAVENKGSGSDDDTSHSVTLLGFDPEKGRFTGSFAGTMTPHLFIYHGSLADDGASLPLETEGPALTEGKKTDRYRDVLVVIDANRRDTVSQVLEADGTWREFMRWRYERAA